MSKKNNNSPYVGAPKDVLLDRTPDLVEKDWSTRELLIESITPSATQSPFTGTKIVAMPPFHQDQFGVGDCGFGALNHLLGYSGLNQKVSLVQPYRRRKNYPYAGTHSDCLIRIPRSFPIAIYEDCRSEDYQTEDQAGAINADDIKFTKNAIQTYLDDGSGKKLPFELYYVRGCNLRLPYDERGSADVTRIANLVNSGFAVLILFYASIEEWAKGEVSIIEKELTYDKAYVTHYTVLIPNGAYKDKDGKEKFSCLDSAKFGGRFLRYLDKEFVEKRVGLGLHCPVRDVDFISQTFKDGSDGKIVDEKENVESLYDVIKTLKQCSFDKREIRSNETPTKNLQKFLSMVMDIEGRFYIEKRHITGYYGAITSKAVLKFQLDNIIKFKELGIPKSDIVKYGGKYFGPSSLKVVNK